MSQRSRDVLSRTPWAVPLLAVVCAVVAIVVLGAVASNLSPAVPSPMPFPQSTPAVESKAIQPLAYMSPVPINYAFYDWTNIDFQKMYPEAGPLGSVAVIPWRRIHINDNQFDWRAIDDYLAAAEQMTVTLDNGTVISKPIILEILDNESAVPSKEVTDVPYPPLTWDSPYVWFNDYTPPWIKDRLRAPIEPITYVKSLNPRVIGKITTDLGSYLAIGRANASPCGFPFVAFAPKYNSTVWQTYYKQMVYALGQRYNNDPRIYGIIYGSGIDGEFGQPTKPFWGCDVRGTLYAQNPMSENDYLQTTVLPGPMNDISDWYRDAFPNKEIFLQFTSAGKSTIDRLNAQNYVPPIGLKQATLVSDNQNQWQTDGNGTIQVMMRYSTTNPIAWENAYAYTGGWPVNLQTRYFTLLAGLTSFPAFMDFVGGWIIEEETIQTGMFDFQRQYLGRTITTTDELWIAMRDTAFWPPTSAAIGFAGWHGDWTYGLYRPEGIPGNTTVVMTTSALLKSPFSLPQTITPSLYSLIFRTTDMATGNTGMSFTADHRWQFWGRPPQAVSKDGVWYDVTLKYVDLGTDSISIEYKDYAGNARSKTIRKRDSKQWITTTLTIDDAYLHGQLPGGTDFRLSADPDRGGVDEIIHMVMIKGHAGGAATPTPVLARPTRTPLPAYEQAVNAGNGPHLDAKGLQWAADQPYRAGGWGYVGGQAYTATQKVDNADDTFLYLTERWWGDRGSYVFDAPNGVYDVELLFAETLRDRKGQRLFDVLIEGQPVLQSFDIFDKVGYNKALGMHFRTEVKDGQLNIEFITDRDSAKVNAVHVTALRPDQLNTPTVTPTATRPAATPTPSVTPTGQASPTPTARTTPSTTPAATPTVTPTLTVDQLLTRLEERLRALDEIVRQLIPLLPTQ